MSIILYPTSKAAATEASRIGGVALPIAGTRSFAVFPPGTDPADLPEWFPPPAARMTDPATSHEAAEAAAATAASDRALVLSLHRQHTAGLTDFELADLADRQQTSLGVRRGELVKAGLIRDSGMRRPTPSGASAIVWTLTEEPSDWAADEIDAIRGLEQLTEGPTP